MRRGGTSASRSVELLRSFENKVEPPSPVELGPRRPTSAVSNHEVNSQRQQSLEQQQQQQLQRLQRSPPPPPPPPPLPLSDVEQDDDEWWHRGSRPLLSRGEDPPPPSSPSKSGLASMHNWSASRNWIHRRTLPSLLTGRLDYPSWKKKAAASTVPSHDSLGAATTAAVAAAAMMRVGKRGRRRKALEEPTGRMKRLDKTPARVTVGDALARGGEPAPGQQRGRGRKHGEAVGVVSANGDGEGMSVADAAPDHPPDAEVARAAVGAVVERPRSSNTGGSSRGGKLLSEAVPKPLLYVGSGGGYRLRP